jgi:hypothetical protein
LGAGAFFATGAFVTGAFFATGAFTAGAAFFAGAFAAAGLFLAATVDGLAALGASGFFVPVTALFAAESFGNVPFFAGALDAGA